VVQVPGYDSYLLARDSVGAPAIIIRHVHEGSGLMRVELQHLRVLHGVRCQIDFPDGQEEVDDVSLIRCGADPDLEAVFLRLMGGLIPEFGDPSPDAMAQLIAHLVDLFRALSQPPRKSIQGLWGELLMIVSSIEPITLLTAWHVDPSDMYDFNIGHLRIEVKTSASRRRTHHFRLEQLQPPAGAEVAICSLITERAGGGVTIADLVTEIEVRLSNRPDLIVRVETVVAETLGSEWRSSAHITFDREVARDSIRFIPVAKVPSIPADALPEGVSNVHFEVRLDAIQGISPDEQRVKGGLFAAAVPD
jgi:hypothetical protein